MSSGKRYSIELTSIVCNGTSDEGKSNDEVFMIYQADAGVPVRYPAAKNQPMNTQSDTSKDILHVWYVNLVLNFDYEVLVTLWDDDPGSNSHSEFLVNYDYTSASPPASVTMSNHNGANYTLNAKPHS